GAGRAGRRVRSHHCEPARPNEADGGYFCGVLEIKTIDVAERRARARRDYHRRRQELAKHMRKGRIALVGHEPNIGELAARLIGARMPLEFKKGGICRIDFEVFPPKGIGQLRWFVTPRMLREIA